MIQNIIWKDEQDNKHKKNENKIKKIIIISRTVHYLK